MTPDTPTATPPRPTPARPSLFETLGLGATPDTPAEHFAAWLPYSAYLATEKLFVHRARQGFMLEVLILLPLALGFLGWQAATGVGQMRLGDAWTVGLLLSAGVVTAVPLMLYANGAKMLRLSTIGILQYIAPTMIFLTAVFWFGEPFDSARLVAFALIWTALVIYTSALIRQSRSKG